MEEIFAQRKAELEIAAKNTIVDIHLIKAQADEITKVLESREKQLDSINAALIELDHIEKLIKIEEKEAEKKEEEGSKPD